MHGRSPLELARYGRLTAALTPAATPVDRDSSRGRQHSPERPEDDSLFGHSHVTTVTPPKAWPLFDLRELWAYRELLRVLAERDIKVRYKQTVLGVAWALLQPLVTMAVFTLVFGRMAQIPSEGYPYPIFLYCALLPWSFLANGVNATASSLLSATQLITRVYFPRLLIPIASIGTGLLDFGIASSILVLLMVYYQVALTLQLLAVPLLLLGVVMTIVGVGSWLAALIVAYRDFRFVTPFLVQLWLFLTPVIYPSRIVPPELQWLIRLNPMTGFVEGFRSAFLGSPFNWQSIAVAFLVSSVVLLLGLTYFGRVERRFADII